MGVQSSWPRNEVIQQLKDVLNTIYSDTAAVPAPADPNGEAADGGSTGESMESASAPGSTDSLEGSGSAMDVMQTLPYPTVEDVDQQEWPPCPWIPKTSLRRWRKPKQSIDTRPNDVAIFKSVCGVWKKNMFVDEDPANPSATPAPSAPSAVEAWDIVLHCNVICI